MKEPIGLAIFVKTPEFSEVKTRLERDVGRNKARLAYEWCLTQTEETYKDISQQMSSHLKVYWTYAEKNAAQSARWSTFESFWQQEGSLGDRLHHVFSEIKKRHEIAVVVGSDSPILPVPEVVNGLSDLLNSHADSIIGPAHDGGFYLFGSSISFTHRFWNEIPYSVDQTCRILREKLPKNSSFRELPMTWDLDDKKSYDWLLENNLKFKRWMNDNDLNSSSSTTAGLL